MKNYIYLLFFPPLYAAMTISNPPSTECQQLPTCVNKLHHSLYINGTEGACPTQTVYAGTDHSDVLTMQQSCERNYSALCKVDATIQCNVTYWKCSFFFSNMISVLPIVTSLLICICIVRCFMRSVPV